MHPAFADLRSLGFCAFFMMGRKCFGKRRIMLDYLDLNYSAYDSLAAFYQKKIVEPDHYYQAVASSICSMIVKQYQTEGRRKEGEKIRLLELGCGAGAILREVRKYLMVEPYAVDFSPQMVRFARENNPDAVVKTANVLDIEDLDALFGAKLNGKTDILVMAAFIHCFPVQDASVIMSRIKKWLSPGGMVYMDTTDEAEYRDGRVCLKTLGNGEKRKYFRTSWRKKEWNAFIINCGYQILKQEIHQDHYGRKWIRTIIKAL